ncbi:MAG: hypothetical protein WC755_00870 [Candidatus Woesearchaeota archaeon]|jgi:hypothetical protein
MSRLNSSQIQRRGSSSTLDEIAGKETGRFSNNRTGRSLDSNSSYSNSEDSSYKPTCFKKTYLSNHS